MGGLIIKSFKNPQIDIPLRRHWGSALNNGLKKENQNRIKNTFVFWLGINPTTLSGKHASNDKMAVFAILRQWLCIESQLSISTLKLDQTLSKSVSSL